LARCRNAEGYEGLDMVTDRTKPCSGIDGGSAAVSAFGLPSFIAAAKNKVLRVELRGIEPVQCAFLYQHVATRFFANRREDKDDPRSAQVDWR
jgi:hypothetical protein